MIVKKIYVFTISEQNNICHIKKFFFQYFRFVKNINFLLSLY